MKFLKSIKFLKTTVTLSLVLAMTVPSLLASAPSNVTVSASTMKLSTSKLTLTEGDSATLVVIGSKKKASFSSDDSTVAKVNKSGKVTAVSAGQATITAKLNKKKLTCKVTVKRAKEQTITAGTFSFKIPKDGVVTFQDKEGRSGYLVSFQPDKSDSASISVKTLSNASGTTISYDQFKAFIQEAVTAETQSAAYNKAITEEVTIENFKQEEITAGDFKGLVTSYDASISNGNVLQLMCYDLYNDGQMCEITSCILKNGSVSQDKVQKVLDHVLETLTITK